MDEARDIWRRAALIEGKTGQSITVTREGILQGKAIYKEQPPYPPEARSRRISGSVAIKIEITVNPSRSKVY